MEGIITLLDREHDALVRALWTELEETLGLRGVWVTPFPHFSYQIAQAYDRPRLESAMRALALTARPFTAQVSGVGLFSGPAPVLYLPVVRTAALSAWHQQVWEACRPAAESAVDYYHPDNWMPHITIGFGDLDTERTGQAVRRLAGRPFNWQLPVDHLAFAADTGAEQHVSWRLDFPTSR